MAKLPQSAANSAWKPAPLLPPQRSRDRQLGGAHGREQAADGAEGERQDEARAHDLRISKVYRAYSERLQQSGHTAPSKRILAVAPSYNKVADGPVAAEVGLEKMRAACPRFNDWLARLETLAAA